MSANQSNPRRQGNTDIKWTVVVVVVVVFQLGTEVQLYEAVNTKFSLKIQAFSPDTEVIEQEKVIEMLDKPIMFNHGQIIKLSKSENFITCKGLLSILSCSSVFCSSEFSNCMFSLIVHSIL